MNKLPSFGQKLISLTKAATAYIAGGMKTASDEEQNKRAEICGACPDLIADSYQCGKCGCFLKYKIGWATNRCPVGKWEEEKDE